MAKLPSSLFLMSGDKTTQPAGIQHLDEEIQLELRGAINAKALSQLQFLTAEILETSKPILVNLSNVSLLDTAGAWFLVDLRRRAEKSGTRIKIEGTSDTQLELIATVDEFLRDETKELPKPHGLLIWLEELGLTTVQGFKAFLVVLSFFGLVISRIGGVLIRPLRMRFTPLVYHIQDIGLNAVPIVALMAFLIGVVLAFQGAAQLRQFGAEVFVVDLIAISVLRELGILLTAIIVAGRTGSAFTASIGSMKMREEIDAMRTLGLDPIEVLVVPRVLALIIALPILGFIADVMGLVGGAVMSWIELGVSPGMFRARLVDSIDVTHFLIGLFKAPFFAIIIGIIGCYEGMMVEGNAESLGRLTSKSVVLSIFMVIVADALFSIFFAVLGL